MEVVASTRVVASRARFSSTLNAQKTQGDSRFELAHDTTVIARFGAT